MATTNPKSSQAALITWLTEGLAAGRFRAVPIEDEEGRILSVNIVMDGARQLVDVLRDDPRQTRPLGPQRQQPGRWRKQRPL